MVAGSHCYGCRPYLDTAQVVEGQPAVGARVLSWVLPPTKQRRPTHLAAALSAIEKGQPPPHVNWRIQLITRRH